jgi:hypothetical protein
LIIGLFDECGDFFAIVLHFGHLGLGLIAALGGAVHSVFLDLETVQENLGSLQRDGAGLKFVAELMDFGE